jgi:hypothetical protein
MDAVLGSTRRALGRLGGGARGGRAAVVSWAPAGHAAGLWGQTGPTGRCPRPDTDESQEVDL